MLRKKRVRLHLLEDQLPSVEGLLLSKLPDFRIARPCLVMAAGSDPAELEARELVIPRERVAFYEVLA